MTTNDRENRLGRRRPVHYGPVVWIVVLLAAWLILADWKVVPDAISNTMAALL